ncbi:MAG: DUF3145 family protein [Lawsonella sp.]
MHVASTFVDATTGVVSIYAAPAALCPRIENTLAETLQAVPQHNLRWHGVENMPGMLTTTVEWVAPVGSGERLAAALAEWPILRFDVVEDATESWNGRRFSHDPQLGMWNGELNAVGDVVLNENQLRAMIAPPNTNVAVASDLAESISYALGEAWDEALEPFRKQNIQIESEVTWLSLAG